MLQTSDEFASALVGSKLFSQEEIEKFSEELPPQERPTSAKGFAEWLTSREKLTPFQADQILLEQKTPLVLGEYVLLERLGRGGMGEVYKAQHRKLERIEAIKMISPKVFSEAVIKRFLREGKAAARLSHPNIVTTYGAGECEGHHYLAMEFIDGWNLQDLAEKILPPEQAIDLILQAATGVEHAHAQGIIHRDIKPSNLMVDGSGKLCILDMGIAHMNQPHAEDGLTRAGEQLGTPDYMAPEQWSDTSNVDARCDIYSLGCTLYHLLTGQVMYQGDTIAKAHSHKTAQIPSLREHCPAASDELDRIFQRMVAKRPQDRFDSMTTLKEALTAVALKYSGGNVVRSSSVPWLGIFNAVWNGSRSSKANRARPKPGTPDPNSEIVVHPSEHEEPADVAKKNYGTLAPSGSLGNLGNRPYPHGNAVRRPRPLNEHGVTTLGSNSRWLFVFATFVLGSLVLAAGYDVWTRQNAVSPAQGKIPPEAVIDPTQPAPSGEQPINAMKRGDKPKPEPVKIENPSLPPVVPQLPDNNWWFGADLSPLNPGPGFQLRKVKQSSPAHDAGLLDDDHIHLINGIELGSLENFDRAIQTSNGLIEVTYRRSGKGELKRITFELARTKPPPLPAEVRPE